MLRGLPAGCRFRDSPSLRIAVPISFRSQYPALEIPERTLRSPFDPGVRISVVKRSITLSPYRRETAIRLAAVFAVHGWPIEAPFPKRILVQQSCWVTTRRDRCALTPILLEGRVWMSLWAGTKRLWRAISRRKLIEREHTPRGPSPQTPRTQPLANVPSDQNRMVRNSELFTTRSAVNC